MGDQLRWQVSEPFRNSLDTGGDRTWPGRLVGLAQKLPHLQVAPSRRHPHLNVLAGDDPPGETPVGLRVHMLVRAKPEKEQEREAGEQRRER